MLLFDHLQADQPSLQQHSYSILENHGKRISKQALDKRFDNSAVDFIKALFENYLTCHLHYTKLPASFSMQYKSIRIMDSTEFKLPANLSEDFAGFTGDGTQACAQIQFEFDVLSGRIEHLSLESALVSDKTYAGEHMDAVCSGDLILRDLGYYSVDMYRQIEVKNAYYVSRLKPQVSIWELHRNAYKKLCYKEIIKRLKRSGRQYLDMDVCIGNELKHPVRLVANLLDKQAIARRIKRKRHRKTLLNATDKQLCQLNLFVTNIPVTMTAADDIFKLYKIRWQVELVFKTWKSILKIDKIRKMKTNRFKCYLISKLLWAMLSWDICMNLGPVIWKAHRRLISVYKCFSLLKMQANAIRSMLFCRNNKMKRWLSKIYGVFTNYGLKEERKNRLSLADLLKMERSFSMLDLPLQKHEAIRKNLAVSDGFFKKTTTNMRKKIGHANSMAMPFSKN